MNTFNIGDRVEYDAEVVRGNCGTVIVTKNGSVGVRFDGKSAHLHNLGGYCEDQHGWWCIPEYLKKVHERTLDSKVLEDFLDGI